MEHIKSFEEFFSSNEAEAQVETSTENNELDNELTEEFSEFEKLTDEELLEFLKTSEYLVEAEEFQVSEPRLEGDAITLKIGTQKYKFSKPEVDIKEIFRKFEKMMGFAKAGGKALAWLHKKLGKGEKI